MRKWLLPIIAAFVLLLWLEPFSASRSRNIPLAQAKTISPPATSRPATTRVSSAPATALVSRPAVRRIPVNRTVRPTTQFVASGPATLASSFTRVSDPKPATPTVAAPPKPTTASSLDWAVVKGQPGYWRLGQTTQGVWWFISPEDKVEFLNTVTTVHPFQLARDPRGTIYMSRDYDGTPTAPGNLRHWAERTAQRILATGFKGLGAWCHPIFHQLPIPVTRDLNIWSCVPAGSQRLYDPGWMVSADATVHAATMQLRNNPHLVGYYLDNELDFSDWHVGPGIYFDGLAPGDPNRREVMGVIQQLWPTIEQFNAAWGMKLPSFQELDTVAALPKDPPETYARLLSAWLEKLMGDYFADH